MKIEQIQADIVDEFSMFEDWMQRYEYMIDLGKSLPLIDDQFKTTDNIIKGCQSKVWVHAELEEDKLYGMKDLLSMGYHSVNTHTDRSLN